MRGKRTKTDSQATEIVGRSWLTSQLYRAGIEVARPERDHGVTAGAKWLRSIGATTRAQRLELS